MDGQEVQRLRDLPIEGVAERLGLRVARHVSLCPFHDDSHPSLHFSMRRNTFRCFVCDAAGGTIDLVMRHLGLGFREACRWLADAHNVILREWQPAAAPAAAPCEFHPERYVEHFRHPWLTEAARQFLFAERRLDPRVVRWCRLASWRDRHGVDWLQVPYFSRTGLLVGVQARNLVPGALPRFRFPAGSECGVYNLPVLSRLRPGEPLWVAEGCSDCWAMLSSGRKAIAIPSATLLKPAVRATLTQVQEEFHPEWHACPDRDVPGERLCMALQELFPHVVRHQLPPGCKDYAEWYAHRVDAHEVDAGRMKAGNPPQAGGMHAGNPPQARA